MSSFGDIRQLLPIPPRDATQAAPLSLAYLGDTVYDLYVRSLLYCKADHTAHGLHVLSTKMVCAQAQAQAAQRVLPLLTEQEAAIYRRGRNAHIGSVPKNASIGDYRAASGLEAVIGYLYLSEEDQRIRELMRTALELEPDA